MHTYFHLINQSINQSFIDLFMMLIIKLIFNNTNHLITLSNQMAICRDSDSFMKVNLKG